MKYFTLLLVSCLLSCGSIFAQQIDPDFNPSDPDQSHFLITKNDDRFFGKVLSLINTEVKFLLYQDTVTYQLSDIAVIEVIENQLVKNTTDPSTEIKIKVLRRGKARLPAYRNFMSETAFRLGKDESELRNSMILYNSYDYGVADHFSLGVHTIPPVLAGVRAKYSNDLGDLVHWGIGTGFYVGFFDNRVVNHSFGILTLGTPDFHLNFTGGYGWSLNQPSNIFFPDDPFNPINNITKPRTPVFTVAGSFRIAQQWRVLFEYGSLARESVFNRFFSSTFSWFKYRSSLDFGVVGTVTSRGFTFAIPVVAFGYRFGNK